jgi:hypothetical protein
MASNELVAIQVPNLLQGISQLSPQMRQLTQATDQRNLLSSKADGLIKRPPTRTTAKVATTLPGDAYHFGWHRNEGERYDVVISNYELKVIDYYTGLRPVTHVLSADGYYLPAQVPRRAFRALPYQDVLLISNSEITAKRSTVLEPPAPNAGEFWVRSVNFGTTYTITVRVAGTDYSASYTTPLASSGEAISQAGVANKLFYGGTDVTPTTGLQGHSIFASGWSLGVYDGIIYVQENTGGIPFSITSTGGQGTTVSQTQSIVCIKNTINNLSQLPTYGINGFMVQLLYDSSDGRALNRWLRFTTADPLPGYGTGTWQEAREPGSSFSWDANTMPHALVRTGTSGNYVFWFKKLDGVVPPGHTFTEREQEVFRELVWGERAVGGDITNPFPILDDQPVMDLFFFSDRLGFVTPTGVCQSRPGDYFALFGQTSLEVLDDDPISRQALASVGVELHSGLSLDTEVILFGINSQWRYYSATGDVMTPGTAELTMVSTIPVNPSLKPSLVGQSVFYTNEQQNYTQVREYFPKARTDTASAGINLSLETYISGVVPELIPVGIVHAAATESESLYLLLDPNKRNKLYVYSWYWSTGANGAPERVLQSWSTWHLATNAYIHTVACMGSDVHLIVEYFNGGTSLGVFAEIMMPTSLLEENDYVYYLDRQIASFPKDGLAPRIQAHYDADQDRTVWSFFADPAMTVPLPAGLDGIVVVASQDTVGDQGLVLATPTGPSAVQATCRYPGNWTNRKVVFGNLFDVYYEFSPPFVPVETSGGGKLADLRGRLQVRRLVVGYTETSSFSLSVQAAHRPVQTVTFNASSLDVASTVPNSRRPFVTGQSSLNIQSVNTQFRAWISDKTHYPCKFVSARWDASYSSQRPSSLVG